MFPRISWTLILVMATFSSAGGCNPNPKVVMPKEHAPPAPRPHVAGPGAAPAEPAAPDADSKQKPADVASPEDKNKQPG